MSTFLR